MRVDEAGMYWSEDWAFSRLARQAGFKIWADPSITLVHRGGHDYQADPWTAFPQAVTLIAIWARILIVK
jgi:GT2 family glycosyltransferase